MRQYQTFELSFAAPAPTGSWTAAGLEATFTIGDRQTTVQGFYDGGEAWRVRFYPTEAGTYHWQVRGVVSAEGTEQCLPAEGTDCGIVRAEGTCFRRDGGAWFYPVGTTIYAMVHQPEALVDQTVASLAAAPFNKVRLCVFPKHYDYNHNEPERFAFAFDAEGKPDTSRPDPAFWQMLERRLGQLNELGIQADVILFHPYDHWGFAEMSLAQCLAYLDYAVRRLAAFPNVWWSLANEYDLMDHFERGWWDQFAAYLHEHDPYGHLLSNHNWLTRWDFHNPHTTHCCIQGGYVERTGAFLEEFGKPVLFDEMCYEGNLEMGWGCISAQELTHRFWQVCAAGGYATHGETYENPEEILWWAKGGVLHGQSPARLAFLRQTLESLPSPLEHKPRFNLHSLSPDSPEVQNNPMLQRILALPEEALEQLRSAMENIESQSHDGAAVMKYLGRTTPCRTTMRLPAGEYTIYVLDTWNMTRTEACTHASGTVTVDLPSREYMAVLAVREG